MRHLVASKAFREGFVEMLPACVGLTPFGLVCGVGAAAAGVDLLSAIGMSAIIFSGAAQILAVQLYAANAPTAVIVLTCFVLGLRFLMYSAAMAPYLKPLPPAWQRSLAFLLTDQAFAAAIRRFDAGEDPRGSGLHFLGCGLALYLTLTKEMYERIGSDIAAASSTIPNVEDCAAYASCNAAVTAIGAVNLRTLRVTSSQAVGSNLSVTPNISTWFLGAGQLSINSSVTVTFDPGVIAGLRELEIEVPGDRPARGPLACQHLVHAVERALVIAHQARDHGLDIAKRGEWFGGSRAS